jgi:hypothetical protein
MVNHALELPRTPPTATIPMLFDSPALSDGSGMIVDDIDSTGSNDNRHGTAPELILDDYLTQFGLVMNTKLSVLICRPCKQAVLSAHIQGHLNGKHPDAGLKVDMHTIRRVIEHHHIRDTFEEVESRAHPPFEALRIVDGFICGQCGVAYGSKKHMKHHVKNVHVGTRSISVGKGPIQHYYDGAGKGSIYWTCIPPTVRAEQDMSIQALRFMREVKAQAADLLKVQHVAVDARKINPWLLATKWYLLTDGHNNEDLRQSVAPALRHSWEECVAKLMHHYLDCVLGMPMADLELQRLHSPDPTTQ